MPPASRQYPDLRVTGVDLEFLQNKAPKATAASPSPASRRARYLPLMPWS